uniref:Protection of telomeres protein 1 n=1 Tax=Plectus sambesii TaxID=2011161 RepID=A0A914WL22_9BILA
MTYMYCSLDSLDEGSKLNIYGVVVSFRYYNDARNPNDEQQCQHKLVVKLLDQSVCRYSDQYAGAVDVTLFSDRKRNLPVVSVVGDILRIHRIKGRTIDGRIMMEGKIGVSGCHAMVWPQTFEGDAEEYTHSFSSGNLFTLTDADKQMIDELRVFYADVRPTSDLNIRGKIAGILRGSYGDVIVQVIGRIRTTRGSVVLRVWDGSRHRNELPIRINEALEINQAESDFDEQLNWIA